MGELDICDMLICVVSNMVVFFVLKLKFKAVDQVVEFSSFKIICFVQIALFTFLDLYALMLLCCRDERCCMHCRIGKLLFFILLVYLFLGGTY